MRNNTRWIIASLILATGGEIPANEPKVKFVPNPLYDVADSVQVGGYLHPGPTGDPVVATIIRKWQRENSQIDRFTAEFSLLRYDAVWKEVKVGRGSFGVDCYRRWFIRIVPTDEANIC